MPKQQMIIALKTAERFIKSQIVSRNNYVLATGDDKDSGFVRNATDALFIVQTAIVAGESRQPALNRYLTEMVQ